MNFLPKNFKSKQGLSTHEYMICCRGCRESQFRGCRAKQRSCVWLPGQRRMGRGCPFQNCLFPERGGSGPVPYGCNRGDEFVLVGGVPRPLVSTSEAGEGSTTHAHKPLYSSSIRSSQQDSLLYT
jgi:hypothetical protein